jgi:hypothetical protein
MAANRLEQAESRVRELLEKREDLTRRLAEARAEEKQAVLAAAREGGRAWGLKNLPAERARRKAETLETRIAKNALELEAAQNVVRELREAESKKALERAAAEARELRRRELTLFGEARELAAKLNEVFVSYIETVEKIDRVNGEPEILPVCRYVADFFERASGDNLSRRRPEISGSIHVRRPPSSGIGVPGAPGMPAQQRNKFPGAPPEGFHVSRGWGGS